MSHALRAVIMTPELFSQTGSRLPATGGRTRGYTDPSQSASRVTPARLSREFRAAMAASSRPGDEAAPRDAKRQKTGGNDAKSRRFLCVLCGFESHVSYFGRKPPFTRSVVYLEDAFVIRNPGLGDPNRPLCLGSHCVVCERVVCAASRCSLFYTKRICTSCLKRPEVAAQVPRPPTAAKAPAG